MVIANDPHDAVADLTEVAILAGRAGLKLTTAELAATVEPYQRSRAGLRALSASLDLSEEPANTFDARAS